MNWCGHEGEAFYFVDESNWRVTESSSTQPLCRTCYTTRYGTPRKFLRPVEEDLYWRNNGVLGVHNLLSSGDYQDRVVARGMFWVVLTDSGSRIRQTDI